jgi:hypothetical protein
VAVNSVVDDGVLSIAGRSPDLARQVCDRSAGLAVATTRIARSASLQDEIAGRSYWHPNGFIKLVLEHHAAWGQVRLHVWPDAPCDDDVHDHSWQYESVVVGGHVREVRYREATDDDTGEEMWRHSYGMTSHRRFTLRDPVPVRVVGDSDPHDFHTGDRSGGAPGHVHRFFAVTAPTVTLLRVGPILTPFSHVYRMESTPQPALVPRPTSRADVAEWIDHVRRIVTAFPAG